MQQRRRRRAKRFRRTCLALFLLFGAAAALASAWVLQLDAWGDLNMHKILDVQRSLILYDAAVDPLTVARAANGQIAAGRTVRVQPGDGGNLRAREIIDLREGRGKL